MKRCLPILLICLLLAMTPTNGVQAVLEKSSRTTYTPATTETQRIYGLDYSREIFSSVLLSSYRNYIIKLTENGSRVVRTPSDLGANNIAARNYIVKELQEVSNGRIEVEILGDYASVVGRLPGYLPVDAPALMVGGHYDTIASSAGANDDATGVAAALELAKVMSKYDWPLDIYFCAWNAEEIGLIGSTEVAQILRNRGVELLAYYNIDMLLVPDPFAPPSEQVLMAYPTGFYYQGRYWADLTRAMSQTYGRNMIRPIDSGDFSGWQNSDHAPFVQKGYTALFAHESGGAYDNAYHTPQDTWDNPLYDYQVATETVKAIGGAMAFTMARKYGEPLTHELSFTLRPGQNRNYSFVISAPTVINVTSRWWGGGTAFRLYNSNDNLIASMTDSDASAWEPRQVFNQNVPGQGLYRLNIVNNGEESVGHEIQVAYETDIDWNGIPDHEEFWFDEEYFSLDSDADSINDGQEMIIGTNRNSNDSDSDTLPDPWEIQYGLDPLDPNDAFTDNDSDSVSNKDEYIYNCNPNEPDSDFDGMPDLWEIENNLDPTTDDSLEDPDGDSFSNLKEFEDGTDPHYAEFRLEQFFVPSLSLGVVAVIALGAYVTRQRL